MKEVVGWFRRIAAITGFVGVILILNPTTEDWELLLTSKKKEKEKSQGSEEK